MERKAQVYFAWFNVLIILKILSGSINSVSNDNLCFVLAHCAYHRIMFSSKDVSRAQTQHTSSQTAQRDCSEEVRVEPGYTGALHKLGN